MAINVEVERRVAALSRPKPIYPASSTLADLERSYAACPLQRKLEDAGAQNEKTGLAWVTQLFTQPLFERAPLR